MADDKITRNLKILAIITLILVILYVILQVGAYFMDLVTIAGVSIVLTYVLLGPVNSLESLIDLGLKKASVSADAGSKLESDDFKTESKKLFYKQVARLLPFIQKRIVSIFIVYIVFFALVIFVALQLIPPAIYQVGDFAKSIPTYAENAINYVNEKFPEIEIPGLSHVIDKESGEIEEPVPVVVHETPEDIPTISSIKEETALIKSDAAPIKRITKDHLKDIVTATASKFQKDITVFLQNNAQNAINNLINLLAGTLTSIGYTVTVLVLTFYFLLDGRRLVDGINALIPENVLPKAKELQKSIHESLLGFLKGQVYLGIATGGFMLIFYIIFNVKYSIFLSLFLAVAEIIPVIGSSLGFIPAIIVLLFTDPYKLIIIWPIFFAFQMVKDNIVAPKIVGEIIGLHPVTVIFALWIGYQVAGFFGILFAIPLASVINVIISFIIKERSKPEEQIIAS